MHGSRKLNLERHDGAALSSPARAVGLPTSPWLPHVQRWLFHSAVLGTAELQTLIL
jgi:hypothetical protein